MECNYTMIDMSNGDDVASIWPNAKPEVIATYQDFSKKKPKVKTYQEMAATLNKIIR